MRGSNRDTAPRGVEERYQDEVTRLLLERVRLYAIFGGSAYLVFWGLDIIVAPQHKFFFLGLRLVGGVLCLITWLLTHSRWKEQLAQGLAVAPPLYGWITVSIMTANIGGVTSPYSLGVLVILFVTAEFLPTRVSSMAFLCVVGDVAFFGLNAAYHGVSAEMIPPIFYFITVSALTCLVVWFGHKNRRADLQLRIQIEEANAKLHKLDTMKSDFFANVSHELRTPLTLCMVPLETMLAGIKDESQKEQLSLIRRNQHRLLRHINNLLDFSKLEAGKIDLSFTKMNLCKRIEQLVDTARGATAAQRIDLLVSVPAEPVWVYADSDKFDKIFMNLLSNAFKFTDAGGEIKIEIEEGAQSVSVRVSDNGIGIPANKQKVIFERFSQVDSSTTRKYAGTGIGLAMVKEYVELHSGTIEVDSKEGEGSSFTFALPLGFDHLPPESIRESSESDDIAESAVLTVDLESSDDESSDLSKAKNKRSSSEDTFTEEGRARVDAALSELSQKPTVVVVDDTKDMRALIKGILQKDYEVLTAKDGAEGLLLAELTKPNLIVSDVMMPVVSGEELCQRIKSEPGLMGLTPVILVTARVDPEKKLHSLGLGADDYLFKPFDPLELELKVRNMVEKHRQNLAIFQAYQEIDDDLSSAGNFQRSLLPVIPDFGWVNLAAYFRPMDDVAGGDIYDVFLREENILRILVIDVTGHGVQGAMRTAIVNRVYGDLKKKIESPASLLMEMNNLFLEKYGTGDLLGGSTVGCTAICADIYAHEQKDLTLRVASASPERPTYTRQGQVGQVDSVGLVLGSIEDIQYRDVEFTLNPGDRLYLFTDGITEQRNDKGLMFAEQGFDEALLKAAQAPSIRNALDSVLSDWNVFRGVGRIDDDVTVVAIEGVP